MTQKCPGQDRRSLKIGTIVCAACGYTAEIFSDEMSVRCPRCNRRISRTTQPSCRRWCKARRQCEGYQGE